MTIRQAGIGDIAAIVAMQKQLEEESAIWGYGADSEAVWEQRNFDWSFLAFEGTDAIGFVYCCPRQYAGECVFRPASRVLEMVELFVNKRYRHLGIGHELVESAIRKAAIDGFTNLRLYSAAKRFDDILSFYRQCGFTPWYLEMTREITAEQIAAADGVNAAATR